MVSSVSSDYHVCMAVPATLTDQDHTQTVATSCSPLLCILTTVAVTWFISSAGLYLLKVHDLYRQLPMMDSQMVLCNKASATVKLGAVSGAQGHFDFLSGAEEIEPAQKQKYSAQQQFKGQLGNLDLISTCLTLLNGSRNHLDNVSISPQNQHTLCLPATLLQ